MESGNRVPHVRTPAGIATRISVLLVAVLVLLASAGCGVGGTNAVSNGGGGGGGPVAATVSGTIAVGTVPNSIAIDPTTNKIYVADFGKEQNNGICQTCYCPVQNGTLTVIDGATQAPTTSAFSYAYSNPLDLAVNPANHSLYVASRVFFTISPTCGYSDKLGVFDEASLTETTATRVGKAVLSARVAVNQNTGNVYVADGVDRTVTILDGSGNLLNTISLPISPIGVAVNATTNKIYVGDGSEINIIDGTTNSVVGTIAVAAAAVEVNPSTNTIYAATGNNLVLIDGTSLLVTATIPVGMSPAAVAVDPATNFIYVANAGNFDFNQHGSVTVINGATNDTTTLTDSNMPYPYRIAVNSTTNNIYVASTLSNTVTLINGAHD
jgi:DNA-binding beta-propeller fold protein YncE